jgi:asparagine synthase (glutamine-hydrolysing)
MCGIVSLLGPPGTVTEPTLWQGMHALRHRGPDGAGAWLSPDRAVGLGHTRLSIMDPEQGAQPLFSEDGQICLVVNGEFYDFEAIRHDLERRGHHFRTHSDSEIALHLYEELGPACLAQLRGEFAFVLWDARQDILFAARDRFGIKPLCYSLTPNLAIASEAKALFAMGVPAAWDQQAFFQAAHLQYVLSDQTLFAGISQLKPGHYLWVANGRLDIHRYWDLDYPSPEEKLSATDHQPLAEELRHRLLEALRLRLRSDVPVCFHLSGGLDSSSLLSLAAQERSAPLPCFTVSFCAAGYDELAIAEETAHHLGASLQVVSVSQEDVVEHLSDAVHASEGLAINGHLSAKYLLSRAIHDHGYKVVVSGEGSDEILAGYPHLRQDLLRATSTGNDSASQLASLHQTNAMLAGIQLAEGETLPLQAFQQALGFLPSFLEAKGSLGYRMRALLSRDFLASFDQRDPCQILLGRFDVAGQLRGRDPVDQASYLWSKLALANYILRTLGDGTEMAHAVEGRLPFLDHHLFAFTRALPIELKIKKGVEKYLLRQALRPILTPTVYRRQKQAFTAPPLSRFSSPALDAYLQDMLRSPDLANLGFFDVPSVSALLDRLSGMTPRERSASDPVLMLIVTTLLIQQRLVSGSYHPRRPS